MIRGARHRFLVRPYATLGMALALSPVTEPWIESAIWHSTAYP